MDRVPTFISDSVHLDVVQTVSTNRGWDFQIVRITGDVRGRYLDQCLDTVDVVVWTGTDCEGVRLHCG
ncbi:hypothetical protein WICPIJ_003624 [Wickerhamomyces pijperi]|uniref:Uncharacterized protein n=1 Tax=Wickerhamomyces pijperi TaxID=599730 RepID=A0A9P8TP20_WICPI|nr:hypothetical protein WICPIJ_003624 [Wickerhamomyces pijperi]